ncbi:alkylhydroperoxidase/carboxymuconolactone decarboxylase family protein YurZ [Nonomuraea thailandensis]|uniref:Alkylhydroperoxidase/carboxymuconolactone decarboxylase family protein YurZ n=1 Tax=Nonomuraea thailandensis TaxID=1188745 RepID=A0A9X2K6L0_9ACTN|nr:carboxymuconolactone decarboxylase family protein [Nonomuraea thailandensis]MCP2361600.1 alkylhydroperoxidase/carboxymuconolactone decarboxylase family protein YurZ [Nonomuraea thailandensis]
MKSQVEALDSVFAEMSAATDRLLWEEVPELTRREKALLCLTADVCQQTLGLSFQRHVAMAADCGLSADDLRELLRFVAYDSGYPAALTALARLTDLEREQALPAPTGQGHEVNAGGTGSPLPESMRQAVTALDAPFGGYMDLQSRMRAGMRLLSVRERAFVTMTVDVLFQTLQESFRAHLTRALAAGATPEEARAVVRFSAQFGMTKAWRAMHVLDAMLDELDAARV